MYDDTPHNPNRSMEDDMRRLLTFLALGVTSLLFASGGALSDEVAVSRSFSMPVVLTASMGASECTNSTGPRITMEAEMALGGLGADIIFSNNAKGTHTYTDGMVVEAGLVGAGETMVLPKQPVLGGVGGNPFMWVQITDEGGTPMTSEIFLGRCVQGTFATQIPLSLPVTAAALISTSDCSNNPGPYITLDGDMTIQPGLNARLIFRNNDNPVEGPHGNVQGMAVEVGLLPPGESIQFPKQPVLGGVGGNPWISVQFEQGNGDPIGPQTRLGRCVQLYK